MRRLRPLLPPLLFALLAIVAPSANARTTAAPSGAALNVQLPLVADDAGLQAFIHAVSTPGSPQYGGYEPVKLLAARFGATPAVRAAALRFLHAAGARNATINGSGMFAAGTLTAAQAEHAFGTQLAQVASRRGRYIAPVGALGAAGEASIHLPAALRGVAVGVIGLNTKPLAPSVAKAPSTLGGRRTAHAAASPLTGYLPASGTPAGCPAGVGTHGFTPQQYLNAYGYTGLHAAGLNGQGQKVALIEIDGFRSSDIKTYAACFGLHVPKLTTYDVSGKRLAAGPESTLDIEVLDSAAPALSDIEVYESATTADVNESLVLPLLVPGAKPSVISASLGMCEPELAQAFGRAGVTAIERDIELAAAAGITEVAASGDTGSEGCTDDRGNPAAGLAVQYPASSPYVTGIGGTNLALNASNAITAQVVWNDGAAEPGAGGGGLSQLFARPSYQKGSVTPNFRSVPDVALLADAAPGYAVYCTATGTEDCSAKAPWEALGGTSAAAPLFAAGAAIVDQDLRAHHRELLGFANPLIYQLARSASGSQIFTDVTQYDNDLGPFLTGKDRRASGCCSAGPGYDDASGWGGVNLGAFDAAARFVEPEFGDVSVSVPRGQRPLAHRGLKLSVGCSQRCRIYAFAAVSLSSGSGGFVVRSKTAVLKRRGHQTVGLPFSAAERRQISRGLRNRETVEAEAFAVGVGPHGEAAAVTPGVVTQIRH